MIITLLILSYFLWLGDLINVAAGKNSNVALTSTMVTLLSWHISTPWGIIMCVIGSLITFRALYNPR
jgi:lipid-A-disaccharide synthase-like uncharacterized protein